MQFKQHKSQKESFKDTTSKSIIDKYGGQEHLAAPPKELLMAQTEHYVEYSRGGRIIKGQEAVEVRSKFDEDVHPGNHKVRTAHAAPASVTEPQNRARSQPLARPRY